MRAQDRVSGSSMSIKKKNDLPTCHIRDYPELLIDISEGTPRIPISLSWIPGLSFLTLALSLLLQLDLDYRIC